MDRRLKADLILLGVAMIWGAAFITQGVAASHRIAFLFNGASFILAALAGWLALKQALSTAQIGGCSLIFASVLPAQAKDLGKKTKPIALH